MPAAVLRRLPSQHQPRAAPTGTARPPLWVSGLMTASLWNPEGRLSAGHVRIRPQPGSRNLHSTYDPACTGHRGCSDLSIGSAVQGSDISAYICNRTRPGGTP